MRDTCKLAGNVSSTNTSRNNSNNKRHSHLECQSTIACTLRRSCVRQKATMAIRAKSTSGRQKKTNDLIIFRLATNGLAIPVRHCSSELLIFLSSAPLCPHRRQLCRESHRYYPQMPFPVPLCPPCPPSCSLLIYRLIPPLSYSPYCQRRAHSREIEYRSVIAPRSRW